MRMFQPLEEWGAESSKDWKTNSGRAEERYSTTYL